MLKRFVKVAMGSEIAKNYDVDDKPIATGGPSFCYSVYHGTKRSTGEEISLFSLKLDSLSNMDKSDREKFLGIVRQDIRKMKTMRHPYTLKFIEEIPETKKEIAFVTEPVVCSLANMCNDFTHLPPDCIQNDIRLKALSPFEITCGLMHVTEALSFLHSAAKLVHMDLSPENIWITTDGSWKIAGFGFSQPGEGSNGTFKTFINEGNQEGNEYVCTPNINYAAPELTTEPCYFSYPADIWSFGCVSWELFTLGQKADGTTTKLVDIPDKNPLTHAYKVKSIFPLSLDNIPGLFQDTVRSELSLVPDMRVVVDGISKCKFFTSGPVHTMRTLETILEQSEEEQTSILSSLRAALEPFPTYLLSSMVLPKLGELAHVTTFAPYLMPCLLFIADKLDATVFQNKIEVILTPLLQLTSPPEIVTKIYLNVIQYSEVLVKKGSKGFISAAFLPLFLKALTISVPEIQISTLNKCASLMKELPIKDVKKEVFPRIQTLTLETNNLSVKLQCISILKETFELFDKQMVTKDILDVLKKILSTDRNPEIIMETLYAYTDISKFLGSNVTCQLILPKVVYLLGEESLSEPQFDKMIECIHQMIDMIVKDKKEYFKQADYIAKQKKREQEEREKELAAQRAAALNPSSFEQPKMPAADVDTSVFDGLHHNKTEPSTEPAKEETQENNNVDPFEDMKGASSTGMSMGGDMFGDMGMSAPEPKKESKPLSGMSMGGDMFGDMGMSSKPAKKESKPLGGMSMGGDMFGDMGMSAPEPKKESKPLGGMSMGGDMFGDMGMSAPEPKKESKPLGGMSMGGDMFGDMGMGSPEPKKESKPMGGMSMGGDMFGDMGMGSPEPKKESKPLGGMSMGGDMFGDMGMSSKPAKKESKPLGGMSMGGDMFGDMDMSSKPAKKESKPLGGMSMGGDMFGDMGMGSPEPKKESKPLGGMSMGGDMFGDMGMSSTPAKKEPKPLGGMSMGGDMFGDMGMSSTPAKKESKPLGGMSMGGDMFGDMGMSSTPAKKESKPLGGMSMGGDMFGDMGMSSTPAKKETKPSLGGMSMGGDMFGDMGMSSTPAKKTTKSSLGGMSMGGDMFGDMGGMSMGGDMFGDMGMSSTPAKKTTKPSLGGMSMGGDMFGDMGMSSTPTKKTTKPSLGGMSMGGDMFGDMSMSSTPAKKTTKPSLGGMSMGGDMFGGMF